MCSSTPWERYQSRRGDHELFGIAMGEEASQADAVVGGAWFFAKGDDFEFFVGVEFDDFFDKAMADHAVADDDDCFLCLRHFF